MKMFDAGEVIKMFKELEAKINKLWCFAEDCCKKIPLNIGGGVGLFKRLYRDKWEFKSIIAGDNITITNNDSDITISSTGGGSVTCQDIDDCLGISDAGAANKYLNEQGDWQTVSSTANLTNTYIGFGDSSNLLTGDTNFKFNPATGLVLNKPTFGLNVTATSSLLRNENYVFEIVGDGFSMYNYASADKYFLIDGDSRQYSFGDLAAGTAKIDIDGNTLSISLDSPETYITNLATPGTLMVVADSTGLLSKQTIPTGSVTSVGLTMPVAFTVTNSPITTSGTIAVTGSGNSSQYIKGDGTLGSFPDVGSAGGVAYYFNGGTASSIPGDYQMSTTATVGSAANFTKTGDGLIVTFATDAGDPDSLKIPAGMWVFRSYLSMSVNTGNPEINAVIKVFDGVSYTTIATGTGEAVNGGTSIDLYTFGVSVPVTTIAATDRIIIEFYLSNTTTETITFYTQDGRLNSVATTFSSGITALNGLTASTQLFATGTSGTDFNISSSTATHTFNFPTASSTNRGALSTSDWTNFNTAYTNRITSLTTTGSSGASTLISNTLNIPNYTIDGILPSQTSNSGKYLTTDGTNASWATVSASASLSGLTAATTTNTIDNANNAQVWNWDTLSTQSAFTLSSTSLTTGDILRVNSSGVTTGDLIHVSSTSTLGNASKGIRVAISGTNSTSTKTNYGLHSSVTNTGTASTNVAGYFSASGGMTNHAIYIDAGNLTISGAGTLINANNTSGTNGVCMGWGKTTTTGILWQFGGTASGIQTTYALDGTSNRIVQFGTSGTRFFRNDVVAAATSVLQSSGSFAAGYVAKTANYTLTIDDYGVDCTTNSSTQTLPTAVGISGRIYVISNNNASNTITINTTSSQIFTNLTGTPTSTTIVGLGSMRVHSDGANWWVESKQLF